MDDIIIVVIFVVASLGSLGFIALVSKGMLAVIDDMAASRKLRAPMKARSFRRRH